MRACAHALAGKGTLIRISSWVTETTWLRDEEHSSGGSRTGSRQRVGGMLSEVVICQMWFSSSQPGMVSSVRDTSSAPAGG